MKPFLIAMAVLLVSAQAQAHKSCDELKSKIEAQVKSHKVSAYSLDIVDKGKAGDGKVVGSCDRGTKEIAYKKK